MALSCETRRLAAISLGDLRITFVFIDNRFKPSHQRRQFKSHDLPENIEVDFIVAVDKAVASPHYLFPGNVGMRIPGHWGDPASRFSDDFVEFGQSQSE